jgi:hypothetical protein
MNTENLVLRPNCLLTKYPLVFLTGPRSLFLPRPLAANLKKFIAAHGYQVQPLVLAFRSKKNRRMALLNWLSHHSQKNFHFILAEETWTEFEDILQPQLEKMRDSSKTLISTNASKAQYHFRVEKLASLKIPLSFRLHQLFCRVENVTPVAFEHTLLNENQAMFDRFLDHCIELAENE